MNSGLLVDWLTLRFPLGSDLGAELVGRIRACLGLITCVDSDGEIKWRKHSLDVEKLRSDTPGLVWMLQGDGVREYLVVAGSPASIEHGLNVFGSLDIRHGAAVLVRQASKALGAILPAPERWQCRRVDVTGNYLLPDASSVKQALRMLLNTDGVRRKASSMRNGGDTVTWNPSSDLQKGKAYHKGPQLEMMCRRKGLEATAGQLEAANRLLRLEQTLGARWFRRLEEAGGRWWDLSPERLSESHAAFFGPLVAGVEVKDMGRKELVDRIMDANGITEGRALAAFTTYRNIRQDGFEETKAGMSRSTWFLHMKYLRGAGIADADLCNGNIIPLRPVRVLLAQPVRSWAEIGVAA